MSDYYRRIRECLGSDIMMVPAVAAVIHDKHGRLCIQKSAEGYSLPAGAIELGETPEEALRREVREETGLRVSRAELLGVFGGPDFRHQYRNGDIVESMVALFRCVVNGDVAPEDDETISIEWRDVDDLPDLAMPWPEAVLRP